MKEMWIYFYHTLYKKVVKAYTSRVEFVDGAVVFPAWGHMQRVELKYVKRIVSEDEDEYIR